MTIIDGLCAFQEAREPEVGEMLHESSDMKGYQGQAIRAILTISSEVKPS
jgi:hypothetical protein